MKNIPFGKGALSVAHAGHELRLYGFLEKVKPYVFVLSEGNKINGKHSRVNYSWRNLSEMYDDNKKDFMGIQTINIGDNKFEYINDIHVFDEILLGKTDFFALYTSMMIQRMIEHKIDYVVADASEGADVVHEMGRILTDIAIKYIYKTTGKQIMNYEFTVSNQADQNPSEDSIHIELDDELFQKKITAILAYHPSIFTDLKSDLPMDMNIVNELRKTKEGAKGLKKIMEDINPPFFKNEYFRPYIYKQPTEKPLYEVKGEKILADGYYWGEIQYEKHIKPLKAKLETLLLGELTALPAPQQ